MCTTDDAGSGSAGSVSTAEAPRTGAPLAGCPNSPAGTGPGPAVPGAALASIGEIQPELAAARAGILGRPGARDADGYASSAARLAAPGQDGPA
jgi:hypothetical protein